MEVADPIGTSLCRFYLVRFCAGEVLSSCKWMEGTSLVVQWLGLGTSKAGDPVSSLLRELRSHSGMAWPEINK